MKPDWEWDMVMGILGFFIAWRLFHKRPLTIPSDPNPCDD